MGGSDAACRRRAGEPAARPALSALPARRAAMDPRTGCAATVATLRRAGAARTRCDPPQRPHAGIARLRLVDDAARRPVRRHHAERPRLRASSCGRAGDRCAASSRRRARPRARAARVHDRRPAALSVRVADPLPRMLGQHRQRMERPERAARSVHARAAVVLRMDRCSALDAARRNRHRSGRTLAARRRRRRRGNDAQPAARPDPRARARRLCAER